MQRFMAFRSVLTAVTWLAACTLPVFQPLVAQTEAKIHPLRELPSQIRSQKDQVSLFVTWPQGDDHQSTVYWINRSQHPVRLATLYGRCYLYLEAQVEKGTWERVQPHQDEQCGTGMSELELPPGHFVSQQQFVPPGDTNQPLVPIRWRSYDEGVNVSSNASRGHLTPGWLEGSRNDSLAIRQATPDRLLAIMLGQDTINQRPAEGFWNPKWMALSALEYGNHPRERVLEVLQCVIEQAESPLAEAARATRERLQSHAPVQPTPLRNER